MPTMLHLVIHHRNDTRQPWANAWLDDQRIKAITTTNRIGQLCAAAMEQGSTIRVHRCAWGDLHPSVCCEASVTAAAPIDRHSYLVSFGHQHPLALPPPLAPHPGQNSYHA